MNVNLPGESPYSSITAVVPFFPWPLSHGDAIRRFEILSALSKDFSVTVFSLRKPGVSPDDEKKLSEALPNCSFRIFPTPRTQGTGLKVRVKRGLMSIRCAAPAWIFREYSPMMHEAIRDHQASNRDLRPLSIYVGESAGQYVDGPARGFKVVDKSNVLTASSWSTLRGSSPLLSKARALLNMPGSYFFERRVSRQVSATIVSSPEEVSRYQRLFRAPVLGVLPSIPPMMTSSTVTDYSAKTAAWVGTFGYRPNWDGLRKYVDEAGLALTQAGWRLRVVGAGATPEQEAYLRSLPFIDFVGFAEDLAAALRGCSVAIVPVWEGAGVKLKSVTLASMGLPLIATSVAMEGLNQELCIALFEEPRESVKILAGLDSRDLGKAALRAQDTIEAEYSPEAFAQRMWRLLSELPSMASPQ